MNVHPYMHMYESALVALYMLSSQAIIFYVLQIGVSAYDMHAVYS